MKSDSTTPENDRLQSGVDRRTLLKLGALGAGAAMLPGCATADGEPSTERRSRGSAPESTFSVAPMETVRIGFVGIGGLGSVHVRNLLDIEGV